MERDREIEPNAPDWSKEPASDTLLPDHILKRLGHDPEKLRAKIRERRERGVRGGIDEDD